MISRSRNRSVTFTYFLVSVGDTFFRKDNTIMTWFVQFYIIYKPIRKRNTSFINTVFRLLNNAKSVRIQVESISKNSLDENSRKTPKNSFRFRRASLMSTEVIGFSQIILERHWRSSRSTLHFHNFMFAEDLRASLDIYREGGFFLHFGQQISNVQMMDLDS